MKSKNYPTTIRTAIYKIQVHPKESRIRISDTYNFTVTDYFNISAKDINLFLSKGSFTKEVIDEFFKARPKEIITKKRTII